MTVVLPSGHRPSVLLLHGLWMHTPMLRWLTTRLRAHGFDAQPQGYFSVLEDTPRALARIVRLLHDNPKTHIVGHSLGGLLAVRAAQEAGNTGRVVCLGSPLAGSGAADAVRQRIPAGPRIVGPHLPLLLQGVERIPPGLEVGMVAGCKRRGLGGVVARFHCEHDGTVAVHETRVPGLADHCIVHASHSGLIFHDEAAAQAIAFLRNGRFHHEAKAAMA